MKYLVLILLIASCLSIKGNDKLREEYNQLYTNIDTINNKAVALSSAFELLGMANQLKNDTLIGRSLLEICSCFKLMSNFPQALEYALQAASRFESINNKDELAIAYNHIGSIYSCLENSVLSIKYYFKSIVIHKKISEDKVLASDYLNLGEEYRLMGLNDSALFYFSKARDIYNKVGYKLGQAYALCNIGLLYYTNNSDTSGLSQMEQSIRMFDSLQVYDPIVYIYNEMAKKNIKNGHIDIALVNAEKAYKMASENNFIELLIDALKLKSDIALKQNDFKHAYDYYKESRQYTDSLFNSQVTSQLAEKRAEFEISRKETEISYLKKMSRLQLIAAIFLGVALLLIIVFAVFLYRTSKRRKAMNQLLGEQNHELDQKNHVIYLALEEKDILIKEIHHRVKNNLQIISSLINLQSMRVTDPLVHDVLDEMQRRIMAISSIHQKLYQGQSVAFINMREYLEEVISSIHIAFHSTKRDVEFKVEIDEIQLNIDFAVPLGLIINELATNSYKYAFSDDKPNILRVCLTELTEKNYVIKLIDNGPGLPEGIKIEKCQSLGLRMVVLLTRQIKGTFDYKYNDGAVFAITFQTAEV